MMLLLLLFVSKSVSVHPPIPEEGALLLGRFKCFMRRRKVYYACIHPSCGQPIHPKRFVCHPSGGILFIRLATYRTREVYWQFKWSPGNLSIGCLVKRFSSARRQGLYWKSKWWCLTHLIGLKRFCSHPFYSGPFCHM